MNLFDAAIFDAVIYDTGAIAPPVTATPVQGYNSGSYVTQMSEAEYQRRRKLFRHNLQDTEFRFKMLSAIPELHAALIAPEHGETFPQKRARERKLSKIIDRRILQEHREAVRMAAYLDAEESEEEELLINYLLH